MARFPYVSDSECRSPIKTVAPEEKRYVAHWRYDDGSASGVLPKVLTPADVELMKLAQEAFGFERIMTLVEVQP